MYNRTLAFVLLVVAATFAPSDRALAHGVTTQPPPVIIDYIGNDKAWVPIDVPELPESMSEWVCFATLLNRLHSFRNIPLAAKLDLEGKVPDDNSALVRKRTEVRAWDHLIWRAHFLYASDGHNVCNESTPVSDS